MTTSDRFAAAGESTGRSPSELRAVLLELGRLLKARHFFSPGDPPLTLVFERTARAWQGDLQRRGPLELIVEPKLIRTAHDSAPVISRELEELVQALCERGIRRVRFEADLEMEAFVAFVELLVRDADTIAGEGGVVRSLALRAPVGIVINGGEVVAEPPRPAAPAQPVAKPIAAPVARPRPTLSIQRPAEPVKTPAPIHVAAAPRLEPPKPAAGAKPPAAPPAPRRETPPDLTMFGEAPETNPSLTMFHDLLDEAETDPDFDPQLTMFRDLPEAGSASQTAPRKPARSPWGEAPIRSSERDSVVSDPAALIADLAAGDALDLPGLDDLDFAFESDASPAGAARDEAAEEDPTVRPEQRSAPTIDRDLETPAPTLPDDPLADLVAELGGSRDAETALDTRAGGGIELPALDADDTLDVHGYAEPPPTHDTTDSDDDDDLFERASDFDLGDLGEDEESPLEAGFDDPAPPADEGNVRIAAPAQAPAAGGCAAELQELLADLDDCTDDLDYPDLARRAAKLADALAAGGEFDTWQRALDLLAHHAAQSSGRTERQRALADEQLGLLASETRVADLLSRACSGDADAGIAATTSLAQLGARVVPALLRAAQTEPDARRVEKLNGLLIAMADVVLPEIERRLGERDPARVRAAVRVARELQSPALVPSLSVLLGGADASLRQEAAKALARIGDAGAIDALIVALGSSLPDVPNLAVFSLGATGSPRAVPALLHALREAIAAGNIDFAREAIRALGRLGRAEATRDLADLLLRRSLLGRRRFRELKLAAASALGQIPGDEAVGALAQAAQSRDPQLRRAAQTALERRAHLLATS